MSALELTGLRPGRPFPQGSTWDGPGRTSRSSPRTPTGSSCACSMRRAPSTGSTSTTGRTTSGMCTSRASAPGSATATASTVRMTRTAGLTGRTSIPTCTTSRAASSISAAASRCFVGGTSSSDEGSSGLPDVMWLRPGGARLGLDHGAVHRPGVRGRPDPSSRRGPGGQPAIAADPAPAAEIGRAGPSCPAPRSSSSPTDRGARAGGVVSRSTAPPGQ
jgi:hypothetical protein